MPGTGADDVIGVIPYPDVPQVYDPPGHVVATANQRPVGSSYPYYIGTSADFFDPGYRACAIYAYLRGHSAMTMGSFATLQASVTDRLASEMIPRLVAALRGDPGLDGAEQGALRQLLRWNDDIIRRRFIQKQPIGPPQKDAGERQALLLAGRQALRPHVQTVEFVDEVAEMGIDNRSADRLVRISAGDRRIGNGGA